MNSIIIDICVVIVLFTVVYLYITSKISNKISKLKKLQYEVKEYKSFDNEDIFYMISYIDENNEWKQANSLLTSYAPFFSIDQKTLLNQQPEDRSVCNNYLISFKNSIKRLDSKNYLLNFRKKTY